jgi:YVTN family beta-propeller protein
MKLRDTFDGRSRFEGDRALRWRSIPANARILSARVTVTPLEGSPGSAFAEPLGFNGSGRGEFGATIQTGSASGAAWVEVDFHSRRTIARVTGTFAATTLQVDVGGGTYVQINKAGAFKTPSDPNDFTLTGEVADLPHLTVAKLKLTNTTTVAPVLKAVTISSVPTNVSLRLEQLPPFWTHPGEMSQPQTSPDFGPVLQAALTNARIDNGFYDLLLTIHSDSIARLQLELAVEFVLEQNPLPNGLPEVVLPFDFSSLPQSTAATLNVEVPPNTRVIPGKTTARVRGNFSETRVAYGATGAVKPVAAVEVSPNSSQAQSIVLEQTGDITAVAVDLLLESKTAAARLRLDVRGDLDGKPGEKSLLVAPVEFEIDQEAGKGPRWTSSPFTSEFVFAKTPPASARPQRYWLVLQSLQGTAAWSVEKAGPGALNMQQTRDSALSWRDSIAMAGSLIDKDLPAAGPFKAFFRLRTQPRTFNVPLELQAGRDESEVRIKLGRFDPLGRVDFALDAELAEGINKSLAKAKTGFCPETEHLCNGDFERWLKIGDEIRPQPEIKFDTPFNALAFAPNGIFAYLLDVAQFDSFVLIVDVACNREIKKKAVKLAPRSSKAKAFVLNPEGTRAYVTEGRSVQIIDLTLFQTIGGVFELGNLAEQEVRDLAISPDGRFLYLANQKGPSGTLPKQNSIRVIDTAKLEQQLTTATTVTGVQTVKIIPANADQQLSPAAVAVSPDGGRFYMVTDRGSVAKGTLEILDTTAFTPLTTPIEVGQTANAIALTPDGKQAVVTNGNSNDVSVIDTVRKSAISINVKKSQIDVAIAADATQAYVLHGDRSVTILDLTRHTVVKNFPLPTPAGASSNPVAIALSPQGDQIYVGHELDTNKSSITPVQFGARLPGEWQLTSGAVAPFCLDGQFHLVAVMGSDTLPTGLSQVVPVSELCAYDFGFWGVAREGDPNETPAVAEVLWLGSGCRAVGPNPEPIPIKVLDVAPASGGVFDPDAANNAALMKLHRVRLQAPVGADQAEVRFTVTKEAAAAIDRVSLVATSEALTNGDFQSRQDGQLAGWTTVPAVAPGFAVLNVAEGIQLRNVGGTTVELVQSVEAKKAKPFTVEVEGKVVSSSSRNSPQVEVRWLKPDRAATGAPVSVAIVADGLAAMRTTGTVPTDAAQAEIHVVTPAGTTLELKSVSLQFNAPASVPVTFISEAPGELTVSDVRIVFDEIEAVVPPIPPRGLCKPSRSGHKPGEADDCCYCHNCESEQPFVEMLEVKTEGGRPATMSRCATCGTELLLMGGHESALAQTVGSMQMGVAQPVVIEATPISGVGEVLVAGPVKLRLTDIHGIGDARARQLAEIGIDSVEKLAASTPETVAQIKFITTSMASQLVEQAKALTGS